MGVAIFGWVAKQNQFAAAMLPAIPLALVVFLIKKCGKLAPPGRSDVGNRKRQRRAVTAVRSRAPTHLADCRQDKLAGVGSHTMPASGEVLEARNARVPPCLPEFRSALAEIQQSAQKATHRLMPSAV